MSVIVQQGSGPFGGLGGLASALGTITGAPWLGAVGMGMNAVDNMYTGGGQGGQSGSMDKMLDYMQQAGWFNPASGSIAKAGGQGARNAQFMKTLGEAMGSW